MIPDFPEIKKKYHQLMMMALKDKIDENSPMTRNSSKKIFFEGNKMGILRENGMYEESEMKKMSVELSFSRDELAKLTSEQVQQKLIGVAQNIAMQMSNTVLETVDKAVRATGNEIASPDGLTVKWIHEAIKKMQISFEDDDPNMPIMMTVYAAPEVVKRFDQSYQLLTETEKEEYHREYLKIMEVKYQEHLADLNQRTLLID